MRRPTAFLGAFIASLIPAVAAGLDVPIIVQEIAPPGIRSLARTPEVVSVGVPLTLADNVTDPSQLGVSGADVAQFRILQRYPGGNAIRWVLASFVANGPGNQFHLVGGAGSVGTPLAEDRSDRILIGTGAATFEIRKHGFNLLDRVVVGTKEMVATHAEGGVVLAQGGTRYTSAGDATSDTQIEENGPVRAVVCSKGVLRATDGSRHCAYTVRLYFYRGQSRCRAFVTLRNAEIGSLSAKPFDAAWVELPLVLSGTRHVDFGVVPDAQITGTLAAGAEAYLLQGDNVRYRSPRTDRILPTLTSAQGVEVGVGAVQAHAGGSVADYSRGWVRVAGTDGAVLAGMRDLSTLFPSGFDLQNDRLAVEMFSRHNPQSNLVFSWGAHETREMLFEFGNAGLDSDAFEAALQVPLLGRCSFERYRTSGAIYGETRLVTAAEEQAFFAETGHTWQVPEVGTADIELERQWSFSTTGGSNQFDQDLCHLIDFLRTGYSGQFEQARLSVQWKADQAVEHSDDFDYGQRQNGVSNVDVVQPESFHGIGAGSRFDDEHPHWVSLPIYYYLTGDEHVRESIEEYAEWRRYRAGHPTYGPIHGGGLTHMRLWSRAFRDMALAYEFTGQARYLEDLRHMATSLTQTLEVGTSIGRNLERGYFYFGDETDVERRVHLFFLTEINGPATQEAMRVLPAGDPLREELRDYMSGVAWFTLQEAQISPDAIGYPYGYFAAHANTELGTRGDQTGMLLTHGYETSGDPTFIERARSFAWRVLEYQSPLRGSELSTHVRIYRWLHRDEAGAVLIDPTVQRNANGSYTLRWTAPEAARAYVVKYGPRRLVENLGFDQATRMYRYDPTSWMNFWAAKNVAGEPAPQSAGQAESFTTPVPPAGTWFFAVKALLAQAQPPGDETPIAIDVEEFDAQALEPGFRLTWTLSAAARDVVTAVHVDRSATDQGPWAERTATALPTTATSFTDTTVTPGVSYWYRLRLQDAAGSTTASRPVLAVAVGVAPPGPVFRTTVDPGAGPVVFQYSIGKTRQPVRFEIFNVRGQCVRVLDQGWCEPGDHTATWDRRDLAAQSVGRGLYFVRMRSVTGNFVQKLILRHR